jgi:hypothetical protein
VTYRIGYLRFAVWFVGLTVGLPIAIWGIAALTGLDLDSTAVAIIPMMIAAMVEGQRFARAENRRPQGREAWRIALHLAGVGLLISVVMGAAVLVFVEPAVIAMIGPGGLVVSVVLLAALFWVLGRLFLGLGARGYLKGSARDGGQSGD